ncbi:MAG: replication-relaxation family protein [Thermodesulfobacteriota bacterium]|nr:replication-relaxation family protein [Thermodesulfobacteriota bacterium]
MAFKLNKNDLRLLAAIAEHRILSAGQVAALFMKSKQVVRRRMRNLEKATFVQAHEPVLGHGPGRPERLFSLSGDGIDLLREHEILNPDVANDKVGAERLRCIDHELLCTWFRIHLEHIQHVFPRLSVQFLSPNSPFLQRDQDDRPFVFEQVPIGSDRERQIGFTPDGVFSITDREQQKALLFFLEVDMGTESVASPKRAPRDVRQKIINYQAYFRSSLHKRYEKTWDCKFSGFRLLFVTNSNARMTLLCRLALKMPPSDFVWVTEQGRMFAHGLSAEIWARGGRYQSPLESILGRQMARPSPLSVKP